MKVAFNKETVISGLQHAMSVMPSKTGAAFLRSIWINAQEDYIGFQSTDATIEFTGSYGAQVLEPGMVGVQGQVFYGLVSNCTGKMELEHAEDDGTVYLRHKSGVCKLPVQEANWYQPMSPFPSDETFTLSGELFQEVINKVNYCIDNNSSLDALTCMLLKPAEESCVDICGLDGHQFAMFSIKHTEMNQRLPKEGLLIQKQYLGQLTKWLNKGNIDVSFDEKRVFFRNEEGEIFSIPRVTFVYPDYSNFLSKLDVDTASYLVINRKDLQAALNRMITVNTDVNCTTDFNIFAEKNEINCSAKGENSGEVSENLAITYNGNIKRITFRTKEFLVILDHFESEVITLKMTTADGPCSIQGAEDPFYVVVAMPMHTMEESEEYEENN